MFGGGGNTLVLHSTKNKETIKKIMIQMDEAFENSHVNNQYFSQLLCKIQNNAVFVVAYIGEKVVGYIAAYINDFEKKNAYITLIAVSKEYQNQHIGQKLLKYIVKLAKESGMKTIKLEVAKENVKARIFYEKNQFVYYSQCSKDSDYFIYYL